MPTNAGHEFGGCFGPGRVQHVKNYEAQDSLRHPDGSRITSRRITEVSKAISKILRHHWSLQVNPRGFAWLSDVQQRVWDGERWFPTEAEILMAVAKDDLVRC